MIEPRRPRYLIERQTDLEGNLLHFITRTGRRPWVRVFRPEEVPPFEGRSAWFEIERGPRGQVRLIGPIEHERG
jgi:hypothetical protein